MEKIIKIGDITFMLGDCMGFLKNTPDNTFDLGIVDPPYGINAGKMIMGKRSRNDRGKNKAKDWDEKTPDGNYFNNLLRCCSNSIIWGGNYFLDYLGSTRCMLLWDKKDYNSCFASHELAWTTFNKNVKCFRRARNTGDEIKIHPTQKPAKLYKWLLLNYAKKGDTILDTHGGSGSIAIACHDLGFKLTIIEKDEEYFNNMIKRFKTHISQLTLDLK